MSNFVAIIGLVIIALSAFLPWVSVTYGITISMSGIDLSQEVGILSIVFLIVGIVLIIFLRNTRLTGIACIGMGGVMLFEFVWIWTQLGELLGLLSQYFGIGYGMYLSAVGSIVTIFGGILLFRK